MTLECTYMMLETEQLLASLLNRWSLPATSHGRDWNHRYLGPDTILPSGTSNQIPCRLWIDRAIFERLWLQPTREQHFGNSHPSRLEERCWLNRGSLCAVKWRDQLGCHIRQTCQVTSLVDQFQVSSFPFFFFFFWMWMAILTLQMTFAEDASGQGYRYFLFE